MRSPWKNKLSVVFGPRPPVSWMLLCLICVLAVVAVLQSSSSSGFNPVDPVSSVNDVYVNYRRLKEQATVDYYDLRSLSAGTERELGLCGRERENFIPCYNVTANSLAGFNDGGEYDRHCELSRARIRCLVRPPKEYKIPIRWPVGRDVIWKGNVKFRPDQFFRSGSVTKRMMLVEENQVAFHSEDGSIFDGVKDYSRSIAEMIGLGSDSDFRKVGVQSVLDIGCGYGSFGAHLVTLDLMAICIAAYETAGSQVQLALERGLPAMIGNFISRQLPFPSLSFDMVHCAECGIVWDGKDGVFLIEVDRVLRPGGYFVLTSPTSKPQGSSTSMKRRSTESPIEEFTEKLCWNLIAQQDETFIWQKAVETTCYKSRKQDLPPLCKDWHESPSYYQPLLTCISGTTSKRWFPIQNRSSGSQLSLEELEVHGKNGSFICAGVQADEFSEDTQFWRSALRNYWSLLTPLIFSDHPKRPGEEDPLPPYNMIRNVMDMSAHYGGLNAAFLEEKKTVWVMNVIPVGKRDTLPLILDRGFPGALHDWCEPFPTYPRTYDLLHASELLSSLGSERCNMMDLLVEMDRILRPEGWVVLSDNLRTIEMARLLVTQIHWEARMIDLQNGSDQRLLVCQKPFVRK